MKAEIEAFQRGPDMHVTAFTVHLGRQDWARQWTSQLYAEATLRTSRAAAES